MTLGYSVSDVQDGYMRVAGGFHGRYKPAVVGEAIVTHAKFAGGQFEVVLPNGELLERPTLPKLQHHLNNIVG